MAGFAVFFHLSCAHPDCFFPIFFDECARMGTVHPSVGAGDSVGVYPYIFGGGIF